MDKGRGLLDRFLISVPFALKPTPQSEEEAAEYLNTLPFITFQAFKKYSQRRLRSVQKQEYEQCLQAITAFGTVVELRVPRCTQKLRIFVKKPAAIIQPWPANAPCSRHDYIQKISKPLNNLITPNILNALVSAGHITQEDIMATTD
ncbi:hypothetical protein OS493_022468 [Desmophyllum pertusum]|uniref:Uncharacterized protein n=1 Tax=Desmophyllum pertusum TaxID=174260 RepID=A0A9W9ZN36_9CNID|nr:hypothetical protein OS493_022468 [Desmophyllum pertusum]